MENIKGLNDLINMPQIPSLDHLKTAKDRNKYPAQELEVVVSREPFFFNFLFYWILILFVNIYRI